MSALALVSPDPDALLRLTHVWKGDELGNGTGASTVSSGHAALDAQLPGGGWPLGAMVEVLQARPEAHVWQLLMPALAALARGSQAGMVALVGSPLEPFGPALASGGLPPEKLLWVRCDAPAARLWASEQALRCADVAAVLAWLPQARMAELRRLQLAAAQHGSLLFVLRPDTVQHAATPARLRLRVGPGAGDAGQMEVDILKRRGPPLDVPLRLPAHPRRLAAVLAASAGQRQMRRSMALSANQPAAVPLVPPPAGATVVRIVPRTGEGAHAVDRVAVAA